MRHAFPLDFIVDRCRSFDRFVGGRSNRPGNQFQYLASREVVITKTNEVVQNLSASDLSIKVGKDVCTATHLSSPNEPSSIGLVFDSSGSMRSWYPKTGVVDAVRSLISTGNSRSE